MSTWKWNLAIVAALTVLCVGVALAQTPPVTSQQAAAKAAPTDPEQESIDLMKQLRDSQITVLIQPSIIQFEKQLREAAMKDERIVKMTADIEKREAAYSDKKVREAGKDAKTHRWDPETKTVVERKAS